MNNGDNRVRKYFLEHVTDLADNQIYCPLELNEFQRIIEEDGTVRFEYNIQALAKHVVNCHPNKESTPDCIKQRIIEELKNDRNESGKKKKH